MPTPIRHVLFDADGVIQEPPGGWYMRENLDYQDRFDTCFYSCDVGVAKPDRGFFDQVARQIGADSSEILFIDDSEANVNGARAAGLAGIHWCIDDGHDVLRDALWTYGIQV